MTEKLSPMEGSPYSDAHESWDDRLPQTPLPTTETRPLAELFQLDGRAVPLSRYARLASLMDTTVAPPSRSAVT